MNENGAHDNILLLQSMPSARNIVVGTIITVNSNGTVDIKVPKVNYIDAELPGYTENGEMLLYKIPVIAPWPIRVKPKVGNQVLILFSLFGVNVEISNDEASNVAFSFNNCVALPIVGPTDDEMFPDTDVYIEGVSGVDLVFGDKTKAQHVALANKTNTALNALKNKLAEVITQLNLVITGGSAVSVTSMGTLSDVSSENVKVS